MDLGLVGHVNDCPKRRWNGSQADGYDYMSYVLVRDYPSRRLTVGMAKVDITSITVIGLATRVDSAILLEEVRPWRADGLTSRVIPTEGR